MCILTRAELLITLCDEIPTIVIYFMAAKYLLECGEIITLSSYTLDEVA